MFLPYLKVKCRDCVSVIHMYFPTKEEMPQVKKGEFIEYFCDICDQKKTFEILQE